MDNQDAGRISQVDRQLTLLDKRVGELDAVVSKFEPRLNRVLRKDVEAAAEGEPREELVPLANEIAKYIDLIERITGDLDSILSRIEL